MFFCFDYVIKEMVNVTAVQPWSYGCTREVAKHERSVRVLVVDLDEGIANRLVSFKSLVLKWLLCL